MPPPPPVERRTGEAESRPDPLERRLNAKKKALALTRLLCLLLCVGALASGTASAAASGEASVEVTNEGFGSGVNDFPFEMFSGAHGAMSYAQ